MMEDLLRRLSLAGSSEELEPRLLEVWVQLGTQILSSSAVTAPKWELRRDIEQILGLLIFTDPSGIVTWKVDEWKPLRQITGFIRMWVERVGQDSDSFPNLVRMLRRIGFSLMPEYGVSWLYMCMQGSNDVDRLLQRTRIGGVLAELLHDSWLKQRSMIEGDQQRFRQFVFLVDKAAAHGEQVAVRLQAQLQGLQN
jgi:hypothetical protein